MKHVGVVSQPCNSITVALSFKTLTRAFRTCNTFSNGPHLGPVQAIVQVMFPPLAFASAPGSDAKTDTKTRSTRLCA